MRARVGPKKGYPVLTEEDKALIPGPDASYNETDTPGRAKPKMYTPQPKMPFCRSGACDVASVRCKVKNIYPVITKFEINDKKCTFSTIPQTGITWWIRFGCKRTCVHVPCVLVCLWHAYLRACSMRTCVRTTRVLVCLHNMQLLQCGPYSQNIRHGKETPAVFLLRDLLG